MYFPPFVLLIVVYNTPPTVICQTLFSNISRTFLLTSYFLFVNLILKEAFWYMNKCLGLSEIEYDLMSYFWEQTSPVVFADILHFCNDVKKWNWAKTTAHTYITRLIKKDLLEMNCAVGVRRTYFAKISREDLEHSTVREFVNSSFSGSVKKLFLSLVPDKPLTHEEVDELHKILDQLVEEKNS